MALTAQKYVDLMSHAIGATPDSRHDLWETLNRAGRAMTDKHPWTWRRRGPSALTLTAGGEFSLPSDFGKLEAITPATGNFFKRIRPATVEEIMSARSQNVVYANDILICTDAWTTQSSGTTQPTPKGLIYPDAAGASDPALVMIYLAKWTELSSASPNNVPNIPVSHEHLLVLMSRAMAYGLQKQEDVWENQAVSDELDRLVKEDNTRQIRQGRMHGGAYDRRWHELIDYSSRNVNL